MSWLLLLLACSAKGGGTDDSGGSGGGPGGGSTSAGLTLLSLNLHCFSLEGTPYATTAERLAAIAATASDHAVHVLAVQEACVSEAEGDAMALLAAALEEASGEAWGTAWTPTHLAWEGTEDQAEEGVGLLARGTALDGEVLDYAVQGALYRRALAAEVGGVTVLSAHLDHQDDAARRMQARQTAVAGLVARPDQAVVLAGDFNARVGSEPLLDLAAAGWSRLSEAADVDSTLIDHVFAPTGALVATDARLLFDSDSSAVSDHPGVLVTLEPGAPAAVRTSLVADADAGWGHFLSVRGDTAPLDWELGWPAVNTADTRWQAAFLGWEGEVAYKWLLDDATWESGEDRTTGAGEEDTGTPAF